jgi:hypothetical protein
MTTLQILGAAALLSALFAPPALAQRMIDEPGAYAFYHPDGDLGIGSAPATAFATAPLHGSGVMMKMKMRSHMRHARR